MLLIINSNRISCNNSRPALFNLNSPLPHISIYDILKIMIRNIAGKATRDIYDGIISRQARTVPLALHAKARRLLDQINAATDPAVLNAPPGNRLEKLRGDRANYWSIRINDQWRIIFQWSGNDAIDVEIIDYHH